MPIGVYKEGLNITNISRFDESDKKSESWTFVDGKVLIHVRLFVDFSLFVANLVISTYCYKSSQNQTKVTKIRTSTFPYPDFINNRLKVYHCAKQGLIFLSLRQHSLYIYSYTEMKILKKMFTPNIDDIFYVFGWRKLICKNSQNQVFVFDAFNEKETFLLLSTYNYYVTSVCDYETGLLLGCSDGGIRYYEWETRKLIDVLKSCFLYKGAPSICNLISEILPAYEEVDDEDNTTAWIPYIVQEKLYMYNYPDKIIRDVKYGKGVFFTSIKETGYIGNFYYSMKKNINFYAKIIGHNAYLCKLTKRLGMSLISITVKDLRSKYINAPARDFRTDIYTSAEVIDDIIECGNENIGLVMGGEFYTIKLPLNFLNLNNLHLWENPKKIS